ncbi:L,D-transpeptidase family protein [Dendrosporobacter sp. 1207_IL3150]|uniref:L,D-transpeptidase family protein n=1 Tax=Dendrosporobacter sp. 1207_IL3150 TaxID=3084054 RepID=UPI002FDB3D99
MKFGVLSYNRHTYLAIVFIIVGLFMGGIFGVGYLDELNLAAIPNQPTAEPKGKVSIVINVSSRLLEVYNDGKVYKKYRIAVGKSDTPSPIGDWIVIWKSYRSGDIYGTRFMALDVPWGGYGIHGTNQPWSIGNFASKGCIRMRNKDVEELFEWVPIGTPVRIEGRNLSLKRDLKFETSGADVVLLQRKLKALGYLEGRADGFFNRDTEQAVKRFQYDNGLKATGIVDQTTKNILGF